MFFIVVVRLVEWVKQSNTLENMESTLPKTQSEKIPDIKLRLSTNKKDNKNRAIVYLVIYVRGREVLFNTGVKVTDKQWDDGKKIVRKNHELRNDYNLIINNCHSRLTNVLVKFKLQNREMLPKSVKDEYSQPSQDIDFLGFMEAEIIRRRGELTDSSIRQQNAALSKLRDFRKKLTFAELTVELFEEFNRWMKNTLKNKASTRFSTIKTVRTYVNLARRKGIIDHYPLQRMPVKKSKSERVFLDDDELEILLKLYKKKSLPGNYQNVLRHFLFGCYTGLRISDIKGIKMDDVIGNMLVVMPRKTLNVNAMTVKIPLSKTAKRLIKDESPYRLHGLIFNTISEQKMRTHLKDVVSTAGIKKDVNFHSARHTFATMFLRRTKNLPVLQKILGHSKIEQTMIYSHILTDDLVAEMKVFDG